MNVSIIYFSQTGNTRKISEVISDTFRSEGYHVNTYSMPDIDPVKLPPSNLIGFGTPSFSSRTPQPVIGFIDSLPEMNGQNTFLFATCAGAPGSVLTGMENGLREKGAVVVGRSLFRGEVHHPAPSLNGRFSGRPNNKDFELARDFANTICSKISEDQSITVPTKTMPFHGNRSGFYEFLGSAISDSTLRKFLPEPKLNKENCDLCQLCSQDCPVQNILLEPFPILGPDCIRCYRCYNICPREAFSANWHIGNPILWLLYNQVFIRRFGVLEPGEQIY